MPFINRVFLWGAVVLMTTISGGSVIAKSKPDFNGVWEITQIENVMLPEFNHPKYTEQAKRAIDDYIQHYDRVRDDPAKFCLLRGMPWTMLSRARNYPVEIYQTSQRVVMFFELHDTHRNIRLDQHTFPDNVPPSANGYSIGHWDSRTLTIETRNLTAINPISPYQRSEKAHIVERWSLRHDAKYGEVLDVDVTVDDPDVYLEPAKGHQVLKRSSKGVTVGGYNCPDELWDSYIEGRRMEAAGKE